MSLTLSLESVRRTGDDRDKWCITCYKKKLLVENTTNILLYANRIFCACSRWYKRNQKQDKSPSENKDIPGAASDQKTLVHD